MQTAILQHPEEAAELLRAGGRVAVPTETVYGLAARYDLPSAVAGIFTAKARPADNPLIVHLANFAQLSQLTDAVPPSAQRLLHQFAPGPLTVTVPRGPRVPRVITAGLDTVAVRIPGSPLLRTVIEQLGIPLVAPSANRSGRPSPTTWQAAYEELNGRIEGVLVGPPAQVGIESTVVDCCQTPPRLLRPGAVSWEQLRSIEPDLARWTPSAINHKTTANDNTTSGNANTAPSAGTPSPTANVPSPGMKYRHYAPGARVTLFQHPNDVTPAPNAMYLGIEPHPQATTFAVHHAWPSIEQYTHHLFANFYQADRAGLEIIYCQSVPEHGLGLGLMDRLRRAAQG